MKIEVRCPSCSKGYLVDEVAGGGELICEDCLSTIPLTREDAAASSLAAEPAETGSAVDASITPIPLSELDVAPGTAEPAEAVEVAPPAEPSEVVCPRCNLHFVPGFAPTTAVPDTRRQRVLIVEDNEYFRQIAQDALSDRYRVDTASNSAEARSKLAAGQVDLLVLDLVLDGVDEGKSLLGELQPKPCPIVIFTAKDESELYGESWDELTRLGVDDLVMKGMNVGESLARKVGALLGEPVDE